jgi:hypothetical protein
MNHRDAENTEIAQRRIGRKLWADDQESSLTTNVLVSFMMIASSLSALPAIKTNLSPRRNGISATITDETTSRFDVTSVKSTLFICVLLKRILFVRAGHEFLRTELMGARDHEESGYEVRSDAPAILAARAMPCMAQVHAAPRKSWLLTI